MGRLRAGILRRPLRAGGAALVILIAAAAVVGAARPPRTYRGADIPTARELAVVRHQAAAAGPSLAFRFERMDHPRVLELGRRERLDAVVDGAATELERIVRLRNWVAAQWRKGSPDPYPPWNALVILDWIRSGRTSGFCAQYSQVFVQALAYLGLTARYVEIGPPDNPYSHYPVEVWSNELDKWVLMDPDFNLHYVKDGVPLSALEIREVVLAGGHPSVVRGAVWHDKPTNFPARPDAFYHHVRFHLKADHLSRPDEDPFDRWGDMVEWADGRTRLWHQGQEPSPFPRERLTSRSTGRREEAYAKLNQTRLTLHKLRGAELTVTVTTERVLQSRGLELAVGDGPWLELPGDRYRWTLARGSNLLRVRAVNVRGVAGPPAVLEVAYRPNSAARP